ncbi:Mce protein [Mycobacterium nebraskense]|uniref:Mce protein n=1 Tax=Mycobacterium nebraskense TaxID=244292 RepID=UPI0023F0CAF9|nr:Mce protein [Mycobacterium nebraskense]MBI2695753.1 Mce protein [Mycobacterium nebraskense]
MAADADTPDGELKKAADNVISDGDVDEAEDYDAAVADDATDDDDASDDDADANDADEDDASEEGADDEDAAPAKRRMSQLRLAAIVGAAIIVALAATVGWLGFRSYQSHQAESQRQMFLQIGRQCALNLTTIDWQHAEGDVQRVLDSATGQFYDQFSKRKQPFIDVLKKAQSKSVGTITEAGVESESGDKAQVLVAVSIKTTNLGVEDQAPRQWRMRITVEKSGSDTKISNVAFVP